MATNAPVQYLTFLFSGEEYAVALRQTHEVVLLDGLTRVPGTPASVRGMLNLRGKAIAVIDLGLKFGQPARPLVKTSCVVIVELRVRGGHVEVGILADAAAQILELTPDQIEPRPAYASPISVEYLTGMAQSGGKFVLLLDADRVLSDEEVEQSNEALQRYYPP